jgi:pimeloyl-ACP methyl ester carboxylesterase
MSGPTATPLRDLAVTLRDGRRVAYAEWGRRDGRPVVLLHGMPGSRLFCPDEEQTVRADVLLLTVDRPGYGLSSPRPGRALLDWVDDYVEWADLVGLPPCPMVGWSSGGPYALACAAHRPELVTSVALAASPAPLDEVPGSWSRLPHEVRELIELLRRDAPAALDGIRRRCAWFEHGWPTMFEPGWTAAMADGGVVDPDDVLLADPDVLGPMLASMREAARQGTAGYVEDWIAESLPWGFSPAMVQQHVQVWWGEGDALIPAADAEHLARTINRGELVVLPGEGHLFPVQHWGEMLSALI